MDNEKSDLYYKDLLEKTETMLEKHLVDVLENSLDKNPILTPQRSMV